MTYPVDNGLHSNSNGSAKVAILNTAANGALSPSATRTSSLKLPVLRDIISVHDAPFNAVGDAARVTDGVISGGALSTLTSATANFKTGQTVVIAGAGTGGTLPFTTTITVGAGTTATLASPALTAVSGATVHYGTDDTAAIQSAHNALSTSGGGDVHHSPTHKYMISQIRPQSNVTVRGNHCTVYHFGIGTNTATFYSSPHLGFGTPVVNWTLRDFIFQGHGQEQGNESPVLIEQGTDLNFFDLQATGIATGIVYCIDCTRGSVVGCRIVNCGTSMGSNMIDFAHGVSGNTTPLTDWRISGNYVSGCPTEPIGVVTSAGANTTTPTRFVITDNNVEAATGSGFGIAVETGGAGAPAITVQRIIIANNQVRCTATGGGQWAIAVTNDSSPTSTNPLLNQNIVISGNSINSLTNGLLVQASRATITGNVVDAANVGISVTMPGSSTISVTGTITSGSATVTGVTGGASVTNGSPLSGTNIPAGTYLKSGQNTGTWIMSQQASNNGGTLAGQLQLASVNVVGNVIHMGANSAGAGITVNACRYSAITNNTVNFDPGSTAGPTGAISVSNCGWLRIRGNDVELAPAHAINVTSSHDVRVIANDVQNPNEIVANSGSGNWCGISFTNVTGTANVVLDNTVIDDRTVHAMYAGIGNIGGSGNASLIIKHNVLMGATNAPINQINSAIIDLYGNTTDVQTFPINNTSVTVGASPVVITHTDPFPAFYAFSGGTITTITHSRDGGSTFTALSAGPAVVPMRRNDQITVTYTVLPTCFKTYA